MSQSRGKQRWKDENFGCWYIQTTGIWKTLWLEYVPAEHIAGIKMTPRAAEGKLDIACALNALNRSGLELEIAAFWQGREVSALRVQGTEEPLELQLDLRSASAGEWRLHTWSPEHPNLYDLTFRLRRNGAVIDEVYSYAGIRDIHIDGTTILLNGEPLYQRLILDQGYWKDSYLTPPDEESLKIDIDRVIAMGYNGVRKHQKIEDERFLYWADVKGLLVWSEAAAAYAYTDEGTRAFTCEWMDIIRQNYNHPSIIIWTPFNESWGVPAIKTCRTQQHFTEGIYHLTKSYDPYRPVIVNDGWEHTISDIITLHDYEEWGEDLLNRYQERREAILSNQIYHSTVKPAFAEGYKYRGQPVIISEFGGIAFNHGEKGWGYGNKVNSLEDFIKRFDQITTAIKRLDWVCGYCYTQVTDVQQEVNGLMDLERRCKVEPAILREINLRKVGSVHRR
jgi:hypothetical protein